MRLILVLLFIPFLFFGQTRKIKGHLYIIEPICSGEINHSTKPKEGKKIIVHLSKDLIYSDKYLAQTNKKGIFKGKISKADLEYYKYLVFTGPGIETYFIALDSIKDDFSLDITRARNETDYSVGKPAIYLYPEKKTPVNIQLDFKGKIDTTFPEYKTGWNVVADTNGELLNLADNRKYNYLFWDGTYAFNQKHFDYADGFVVKKENTASFLIDKLSHIGLNNTEVNDFVVYWLPMISKNDYTLIHFWINDNIDNTAFLTVNPKPDTSITLFVEFQKTERAFQIKEQVLPKLERKGFTLVEWGGSLIPSGKIE